MKKITKNIKKTFMISRLAEISLFSGLTLVLIYLTAFLFMLLASGLPGYILSELHAPTLEHIVMTAVIVVVGSLLIHICDTEKNRS